MEWDKRRSPRFECRGAASVRIAVGEPPCQARIVDLSLDGCLLVSQRPHGLTQDMKVELIFEVRHLPFRVRGQVKVLRSETMVGFEFVNLTDRVRRDLYALIEELKEEIIKRVKESKTQDA
jgi:c-di-GMP-binding flagellar brake protein YcgR